MNNWAKKMETTSATSSSEIAEALKELLHFLQPSQRTDIKSIAVMNLLSKHRKALFSILHSSYSKQKLFICLGKL